MSRSPKTARSLASVTKIEPAIQEQVTAIPPVDEPKREKPVGVMMYVSPSDHDKLRDLSHHSRTSLQKLGIEAWNLLLQKRGLPLLEAGESSGAGAGRKPK